jgi:hypothetical protein
MLGARGLQSPELFLQVLMGEVDLAKTETKTKTKMEKGRQDC